MDIHDIPGVTVLNMSEFVKNKYMLEIIFILFISVILFCLIPVIFNWVKDLYIGVTVEDYIFGIIIVILIVLDSAFIYNVSTNIDNLSNPLYEITLDETVSSDLYTYYTIKEQRGNILEVYPNDDNKADKYIIEQHSSN